MRNRENIHDTIEAAARESLAYIFAPMSADDCPKELREEVTQIISRHVMDARAQERSGDGQYFYCPQDIAAITRLSVKRIYHYHHELTRRRELSEPISARWPLERPDALRLIEYIEKHPRRQKLARQ